MKNVTLALPEDVARWARVWAAEHETSVSKMLGDMLRARMEVEQGYGHAMDHFLSRTPRALKTGGRYPSREDVHER